MKKNIGTYIPFLHDNFEFKKNVIDLARKQTDTFEGIHTATLIYVNAVDYIAQHLLENLISITYLITTNESNGVVFFNEEKIKGLPLGKTIRELEKYEFPDKKDFMQGLKEFVEIRNRLVHNLLSLTTEQVSKINDDFTKIKELSEGLLNKYDSLTKGISNAWIAYMNKLVAAGNAPLSTDSNQKHSQDKKEK